MNLAEIAFVSFDCYGTLIDWETGIVEALQPVLRKHGVELSAPALLNAYAAIEPTLQRGPYRPYREILRDVVREFGRLHQFAPHEAEMNCLVNSLTQWPPFSDTVPALRELQRRFPLGVLSNIDRDLFAGTEGLLGIKFRWVITAEEVRSYKPALGHFETMLARTGLPPKRHLHVASSLFHDVAPANALGIRTVWVNRSDESKASIGMIRNGTVKPEQVVGDLAELVTLLNA